MTDAALPPIPRHNSGVAYCVLDLAPITVGSTTSESFRNSLDLAQHAERWGYHRYWLAEHHNIPRHRQRRDVGANRPHRRPHAKNPRRLRRDHAAEPRTARDRRAVRHVGVAVPGRIDLGLGRAPGGDTRTARALRRNLGSSGDTFPRDLAELIQYFRDTSENGVRAIPGHGVDVPIYLLGSSDFSATLAAELGLPFAFASHFAPEYLHVALELYRTHFKPSPWLERPHVMVGVNVFTADTDAEARRLFTTLEQAFLGLVRGTRTEIPPPVDSLEWTPPEQAHVLRMTRYSAVGSVETVRQELEGFITETRADEIIATAQIFDHAARLRSFELTAEVFRRINSSREAAPVTRASCPC
jgi:luciferase family oxidoreductase group 1